MSDDHQNLALVETGQAAVDAANAEFYSAFPYPWPPIAFPRLEDPRFEAVMLNQSFGDFTHRTVPADGKVWVAGCGTNQAVYTALRFPEAAVLGSDLSAASLELASRNAKTLGLTHLTLRQESLNQVTYAGEFDHIICTGVIHHNADPAHALRNLSRALRPGGVLELMVYNRFHRWFNVSAQKAVRMIMRHAGGTGGFARELELARALIASEPIASSAHMDAFGALDDAHLADAMIQPVEHAYTVESLDALAAGCGLELMLPCLNQFDLVDGHAWTIAYSTPELQAIVDAMPDVARWQLANLMLLEKSPFLWFYLRHRTASGDGRYEARVNEEFLARRFVRASTSLRNHVRGVADLDYKPAPAPMPYPSEPEGRLVRDVVRHTDGRRTMREILRELEVDTTSSKAVTDLRTSTTTTLCPLLRAV